MFSAMADHGAPIGKPCQYHTKITRYAIKQAMRPHSSLSDHSSQAMQLAPCPLIPLSLSLVLLSHESSRGIVL